MRCLFQTACLLIIFVAYLLVEFYIQKWSCELILQSCPLERYRIQEEVAVFCCCHGKAISRFSLSIIACQKRS